MRKRGGDADDGEDALAGEVADVVDDGVWQDIVADSMY